MEAMSLVVAEQWKDDTPLVSIKKPSWRNFAWQGTSSNAKLEEVEEVVINNVEELHGDHAPMSHWVDVMESAIEIASTFKEIKASVA